MLEIDSLHAYYGKSHVLEGLSLNISSDEIVALMGRNGAGKTTTIRSILGFVPRVEGMIEFDGNSIIHEPPENVFNRGITWIPERRRIFSNLTVADNIRMGMTPDTEIEQVKRVYDLFPRLDERRSQQAGTMSGGEQQMLAIARALTSDPDLLLVDEPFEGLMPTLIPEIAEVLGDLGSEGMAMLIADQKAKATLDLADRVYVIERGSIVVSDTPDRLREDDAIREQYLGVRSQ
jgi:branched-chain amino acid transport system ATP-binding protein